MARGKRIWRESQHPRDGKGRFARRGGAAWVKRAAAEISSLAGEAGNATRGEGGRPRISRNAKAGVVLQAHTDGGRPSAVRVPQATVTQRPSPAGLAAFNAQRLPTPVKRAAPQPKNLDAFNAPDAPAVPKKRVPRQSPGAAALIAARANEQAPHVPAMVAARTAPEAAPVQGAEAYAAMRRHTLLALARDAKISIRGKSNTQIANELAAHDAKVKADRAAKLNPSGVGTSPEIQAKEAELAAARERVTNAYQGSAGFRSMRAYRANDAQLRRAGEAGRDVERLEKELRKLRGEPEPKAPTPLPPKPETVYDRYGNMSRAEFDALPAARRAEIAADLRATSERHRGDQLNDGGAALLMGKFGLSQTPAERAVDTPRANSQDGGMTSTTPGPRMKRAHATALRQIDAKGEDGLNPGTITLADTRALREAGYIEERDINAPGRPKRLFLTEAGAAALRDDDPEAYAKREAAKVKAAERAAAQKADRERQAAASAARGDALEEQARKEGLDPMTARLGGMQAARDKKARDDAAAAVAAQAAVDRGAPSYTAGHGGTIGENFNATTAAVNRATKGMLKDGISIEDARAAATEQARAYAIAMGRVDSARWDRDQADARREYFKNLRDLTGDPAYDERVKEANADHFEKQRALRDRVAEAKAARAALEEAVVGAYAAQGKRKAAKTLKLPDPVDSYGKAGPSLADRVDAAVVTDRKGPEVRAARLAALDRIRQEDHLANLKRERERHESKAGSIMRYEGGDQGNREARQRAAEERAKAGRIRSQEFEAETELKRLKQEERRAVDSIPKKTGHEYADVVAAVRAAGANGGADGIRDDPAKERAYRNDIRRRLGLPLVTDDEPQLKSEAFSVPRDGVQPGDYVGGGNGSPLGFQVAAIEPQEDGSILLTGVGLNGVQTRTLKPGEDSLSVWRPGVSDQNRQPLRPEEADLPTMARRMLQGFTDERARLAAANRIRASKGLPEKGMEPGRVYPGQFTREAKVAALKSLPKKRVDTPRDKSQNGGMTQTSAAQRMVPRLFESDNERDAIDALHGRGRADLQRIADDIGAPIVPGASEERMKTLIARHHLGISQDFSERDNLLMEAKRRGIDVSPVDSMDTLRRNVKPQVTAKATPAKPKSKLAHSQNGGAPDSTPSKPKRGSIEAKIEAKRREITRRESAVSIAFGARTSTGSRIQSRRESTARAALSTARAELSQLERERDGQGTPAPAVTPPSGGLPERRNADGTITVGGLREGQQWVNERGAVVQHPSQRDIVLGKVKLRRAITPGQEADLREELAHAREQLNDLADSQNGGQAAKLRERIAEIEKTMREHGIAPTAPRRFGRADGAAQTPAPTPASGRPFQPQQSQSLAALEARNPTPRQAPTGTWPVVARQDPEKAARMRAEAARQQEAARQANLARAAARNGGTGPGAVPVGGTDADRRAAAPRLEINGQPESDRAYAVRTAPTREAAVRILEGYQLPGLRAIARDEGVVTSGSKKDLVARLMRVMRDRWADSQAITGMVNRVR